MPPIDLDIVLPRQNPGRSPNPFGPAKTAAAAAPTTAPADAPNPPRALPSLLGGATTGGLGGGPAGGIHRGEEIWRYERWSEAESGDCQDSKSGAGAVKIGFIAVQGFHWEFCVGNS